MRVLHQDASLLAVDKPAGALVIPGRAGPSGVSLRERLEATMGRKLWVVHRLDQGTSGVLLFALDAQMHRVLCGAFEHGAVHKEYGALVEGDFAQPREVCLPLARGRKGRVRPARPGEEGKPASSRFEPQRRLGRASWVLALPRTGRQHQLRVHLEAIGHPLLVDPQYGRAPPLELGERGGVPVLLERTPLHASILSLVFPSGQALRLEAPLPADLEDALAVLAEVRAPT